MRLAPAYAILFALAFLLAGCTFGDLNEAGSAVAGQAMNQAVSEANPLKPQAQCKGGLVCRTGVLMSEQCLTDGSSYYGTVDPEDKYGCRGDKLVKFMCGGGDDIIEWETDQNVYCSPSDLRTAYRMYCSGGELKTEMGIQNVCSTADNRTVYQSSCEGGTLTWTTMTCIEGYVCRGSSGNEEPCVPLNGSAAK